MKKKNDSRKGGILSIKALISANEKAETKLVAWGKTRDKGIVEEYFSTYYLPDNMSSTAVGVTFEMSDVGFQRFLDNNPPEILDRIDQQGRTISTKDKKAAIALIDAGLSLIYVPTKELDGELVRSFLRTHRKAILN